MTLSIHELLLTGNTGGNAFELYHVIAKAEIFREGNSRLFCGGGTMILKLGREKQNLGKLCMRIVWKVCSIPLYRSPLGQVEGEWQRPWPGKVPSCLLSWWCRCGEDVRHCTPSIFRDACINIFTKLSFLMKVL